MTNTGTGIQRELHSTRKPREGIPPELAWQRGRLPRVSQVMELANSFQCMIENGEATDYANLARTAGLSRQRMSQIMELLWLAPKIQQKIPEFPAMQSGRVPISEVTARKVAEHLEQGTQQVAWDNLKLNARVGRGTIGQRGSAG
jgi:hypothetical protein